jgi:hypothetical protein
VPANVVVSRWRALPRICLLPALFDVPVQVKNHASKHPDIRVALASDPSVSAAGKVRAVAPRADPVTGTFAVRVRLMSAFHRTRDAHLKLRCSTATVRISETSEGAASCIRT